MKKRVLTIVNDEIAKDPRASKFRDTLSVDFEVYNICSSFNNEHKDGPNIVIKKNKLFKILGLFIYWIKVVYKVKRIKPDIILAHDCFMALPGVLASIIYSKPLVYDAYEFYVPQRGVKMSGRDWFFYLVEKQAIRRSRLVFSANLERSRLMKCVYKLDKLPVPVLNIPSYKLSSSNKKMFNSKSVTVVYEGYISFSRFVNLLVDSFEYLPDSYTLLFIGSGHDEEKLKLLISGKSYKNRVEFMGRIDSADIIPTLATKCDIGFVGYPFSNLNNRFCSPNKIYEYPAAGIPFISTKQSPIWRATKDYHICDYYDPEKDKSKGIADAIQRVANKYYWYQEKLNEFIEDNSWENEKKRILEAFSVF